VDNVSVASAELDRENVEEMLKLLRTCENVFYWDRVDLGWWPRHLP